MPHGSMASGVPAESAHAISTPPAPALNGDTGRPLTYSPPALRSGSGSRSSAVPSRLPSESVAPPVVSWTRYSVGT